MTNNRAITKIIFVFFGFVLFFLLGFFIAKLQPGNSVQTNESNGYTVTGDIKQTHNEVNVNLLWEVWNIIEEQYIEKTVNGSDLLYGSIKGLVAGLDDPYTAFLTPDETKDYMSSNKGEFEGIGTTLKEEDGYVAIETPIDGSPAQKAGLIPGDLILKVNSEEVQGKSVYEVASKIRGEAGTKVAISYYRPSEQKNYDIEIVRQKIDIDNIELKDNGDGYVTIKIYKFTEESVVAFNAQWDKIIDQVIAKNPKGIIIDLRNNPGGYVSAVEHVLGEFLPKGKLIFSEQDRNGKKVDHLVTRNGRLLDKKLVVIVNEGSASASEIFSGAMQDHKRAEVVGQKTVGKGLEQRLVSLSDGSTLQLVFQKWLTPNGKNISKDDPIKPDHEVKGFEEQTQKALELLK